MATGGYACDFVDPVPESLSCAVCLLPFRDPHLVSCCGSKFCAPCINQLKAADKPCPVCVYSREFTSLLDRGYQRKVLNLKVVCSRKNDGCQWEGKLHDLDHHDREECEWAVVHGAWPGYSYQCQCGAHLPRKEVEQLIESRMVEHKKEMERKKAESTRKVKKRKRQMESQGNSSKGCLSIIIIIMHHCLKNTLLIILVQAVEDNFVDLIFMFDFILKCMSAELTTAIFVTFSLHVEVWVCISSESEDEKESVVGSHHGGMA